ncbi:hypothetical protein CH361_19210 [Leptospira brenneri]|nr:hypothetical protein CH361_19210 [Leptospira brenneri]
MLIRSKQLSQKLFAESIGVTPGFVSAAVKQGKSLSKETILKISEVHQVSLEWLLTGEGQMFYPSGDEVKKSLNDFDDMRNLNFQMQDDPILKEVILGAQELSTRDRVALEVVNGMIKKLVGK